MFVPGRPFKTSLIFVIKGRSLPKSGTLERCFTQVGSGLTKNIRLSLKGLPRTNTSAYYEHSQFTDVNYFITFGPGSQGRISLNLWKAYHDNSINYNFVLKRENYFSQRDILSTYDI